MNNVDQTVISEYANSPTMLALIHSFNDCIDPTADMDNFYNVCWNVDTAIGFGLDIWGRIVGLPTGRYIYTNPVTVLDDDQFRKLILIKALSNISTTNSRAFNKLLRTWLAGRGRAYVSDQGNMFMRYTFEFALEPYEIQILRQPGIFLRPAGVGVGLFIIELPVWGFSEAGTISAAPFDQAPFVTEEGF